MSKLWLISGNPFDIVGARATGMQAIWVDRVGAGWKNAAAPDLQPTGIVQSGADYKRKSSPSALSQGFQH